MMVEYKGGGGHASGIMLYRESPWTKYFGILLKHSGNNSIEVSAPLSY